MDFWKQYIYINILIYKKQILQITNENHPYLLLEAYRDNIFKDYRLFRCFPNKTINIKSFFVDNEKYESEIINIVKEYIKGIE